MPHFALRLSDSESYLHIHSAPEARSSLGWSYAPHIRTHRCGRPVAWASAIAAAAPGSGAVETLKHRAFSAEGHSVAFVHMD